MYFNLRTECNVNKSKLNSFHQSKKVKVIYYYCSNAKMSKKNIICINIPQKESKKMVVIVKTIDS